jgi:nucleotide-binding universal stress UspA family protein
VRDRIERAPTSVQSCCESVVVGREPHVTQRHAVRIVVGVDGSADARTAAEWAVHEAVAHGGRLLLVHAWSLPAMAGGGATVSVLPIEDLQQSAAQLVAGDASDLREVAPEVEIDTRLEYGSPIPVLLELAADAELIVVGSRGMGRVVGLLLGSVSQPPSSSSSTAGTSAANRSCGPRPPNKSSATAADRRLHSRDTSDRDGRYAVTWRPCRAEYSGPRTRNAVCLTE